jgi:hypothetical protein
LLTGSHIVADWGGVLGVTDGQADEGTGDADSTQPGEPPARYVPADGGAVPIRGPWRLVRPAGARVLAPLLTTQEVTRGQLPHPAATLKRVGKGMIAAIYGPVAAMYADYRYPRIRAFAGGVLKVLTGLMPVEVDAPAHVVMTVRRQPGRTIVHLVNTASTNPLSPACPCMEDVPTAGPITVRAQCARRPKAVGLVPEGARSGLEWKWRAGTLTAVIPALRIHAALVIEEA